jgi:hypothetical protein
MLYVNRQRNSQPASPDDVISVTDPGRISLSVSSGQITYMPDGSISAARPGAIAFCDPTREAEPRKIVLELTGFFFLDRMDQSECDMLLE